MTEATLIALVVLCIVQIIGVIVLAEGQRRIRNDISWFHAVRIELIDRFGGIQERMEELRLTIPDMGRVDESLHALSNHIQALTFSVENMEKKRPAPNKPPEARNTGTNGLSPQEVTEILHPQSVTAIGDIEVFISECEQAGLPLDDKQIAEYRQLAINEV